MAFVPSAKWVLLLIQRTRHHRRLGHASHDQKEDFLLLLFSSVVIFSYLRCPNVNQNLCHSLLDSWCKREQEDKRSGGGPKMKSKKSPKLKIIRSIPSTYGSIEFFLMRRIPTKQLCAFSKFFLQASTCSPWSESLTTPIGILSVFTTGP